MNKTRKIKYAVIVTDCKDVAFNELRSEILSECERLGNNYTKVEPLVPAEEFSIINGAFVTRLMAEHYKQDTLFMLILNPCQQRPKRIFGELTNGNYFEGADTGTLNWLFHDFGIKSLYEIKENRFYPFGGKYVHAPTVAKMVSGIPFQEYGNKINEDELCDFSIKEGTIVHIDNFGIMKIKGEFPDLPDSAKVKIFLNGKKSITAIISRRMMNEETGTWVFYPGSSMGLPELSKVRCKDGAREINAQIGDIITWRKV